MRYNRIDSFLADQVFELSCGHVGSARISSLTRWATWLREETVPARKRLLETIRSGEIPGHILHHFACWSLEQSLLHAQKMRYPHTQELWQLLTTKRAWIEGQATLEDVQTIKLSLQRQDATNSPEDSPQKLLRMGIAAASHDPIMAARYACAYPLQEEDHAWQCEELARQISLFVELRTQLFALLVQHVHFLEGRLHFWKHSYERGLFGTLDPTSF
ncbi:MAG: hypothetical protein H6728_08635 [Myxococcales bacterium]|nr:hypothetical protein [Myxococcales bacterium]MCB9643127.1 hypothetical protein [Myxococcales bacterium]